LGTVAFWVGLLKEAGPLQAKLVPKFVVPVRLSDWPEQAGPALADAEGVGVTITATSFVKVLSFVNEHRTEAI